MHQSATPGQKQKNTLEDDSAATSKWFVENEGDGICVPGKRLSSQYHDHRTEHWVVVDGTAKIERQGETILLEKDQSLHIPIKTVHRLENPRRHPCT